MPTHGSPRVGDLWSRPADRLLWALRAVGLDYRCSPSGAWSWRATCPACGTAEALSIAEAGPGGAVSISCRVCPRERVLAALIEARERARERVPA